MTTATATPTRRRRGASALRAVPTWVYIVVSALLVLPPVVWIVSTSLKVEGDTIQFHPSFWVELDGVRLDLQRRGHDPHHRWQNEQRGDDYVDLRWGFPKGRGPATAGRGGGGSGGHKLSLRRNRMATTVTAKSRMAVGPTHRTGRMIESLVVDAHR